MTWQPAPVMPRDIELWAATYLRDALFNRPEPVADAFVSNSVPATRRDQMVIVRRDGGQVRNLRDTARLAVRCWGQSEQDATDLARLVVALLFIAPATEDVLRVTHLSGPLAVSDESGQPQRYALFEIESRAEEITP